MDIDTANFDLDQTVADLLNNRHRQMPPHLTSFEQATWEAADAVVRQFTHPNGFPTILRDVDDLVVDYLDRSRPNAEYTHGDLLWEDAFGVVTKSWVSSLYDKNLRPDWAYPLALQTSNDGNPSEYPHIVPMWVPGNTLAYGRGERIMIVAFMPTESRAVERIDPITGERTWTTYASWRNVTWLGVHAVYTNTTGVGLRDRFAALAGSLKDLRRLEKVTDVEPDPVSDLVIGEALPRQTAATPAF